MTKDTVTIVDNRTGRTCELPIADGALRATDLQKLGVLCYDPAFMNTASARSAITFIDGDKGILWYRGYRSSSSRAGHHFWRSRVSSFRENFRPPGNLRTGRGRSRTTRGCTSTSRSS
jgi:hypothetical protein